MSGSRSWSARLNRSSRNSSQPPSVDPPGAPQRRSKDPSGRKQGAQDGHEGHGRPLLPAWAVDEVIEHWPERCGCGHAFSDDERVAVGEPVRWQVEELPPITVRVTEHRAQRVRCPDCGEHTRAELSGRSPAAAFGPRLQAAVATLSVRNRISRARRGGAVRRAVRRADQHGHGRRDPHPRGRMRSPSRTPTCSSVCAARRR